MKEKLEERLKVLQEERQKVIEQLAANVSAYNGAIQEVEHWIIEVASGVEGVVAEVIDAVIPDAIVPVETPAESVVEPVAGVTEPVDPTITTSPMEVPVAPAE